MVIVLEDKNCPSRDKPANFEHKEGIVEKARRLSFRLRMDEPLWEAEVESAMARQGIHLEHHKTHHKEKTKDKQKENQKETSTT